jgi:hypothetical protein
MKNVSPLHHKAGSVAYLVFLSEGESAPGLSGSPAKSSIVSDGSACSSGSSSITSGTLPSTAPQPVQTQQPCSLKGSLSSDSIYGGGMATHAGPGQGTYTHIKDKVYTLWHSTHIWRIPVPKNASLTSHSLDNIPQENTPKHTCGHILKHTDLY